MAIIRVIVIVKAWGYDSVHQTRSCQSNVIEVCILRVNLQERKTNWRKPLLIHVHVSKPARKSFKQYTRQPDGGNFERRLTASMKKTHVRDKLQRYCSHLEMIRTKRERAWRHTIICQCFFYHGPWQWDGEKNVCKSCAVVVAKSRPDTDWIVHRWQVSKSGRDMSRWDESPLTLNRSHQRSGGKGNVRRRFEL